jgi:hypothetical protein
MTVYLVVLAALMLCALAAPFSAPVSPFRYLRAVPMLAVYPLFVAMAATEGIRTAGLWWGALTGIGVLLLLIAEAGLPRAEREAFPGAIWRTPLACALAWPVMIPAAMDLLVTRLGIVQQPAEPRLPEPPRGSELFALSDDEMLVAAHQILSGHADLTAEERTILVAETFNREVHGGGFGQWFSNTESSVPDTVQALRAVGAEASATLLKQAGDEVPATWSENQPLDERLRALKPIESALRPLVDRFFSLERQEDLTSLVATFVRRYRSRCPALA